MNALEQAEKIVRDWKIIQDYIDNQYKLCMWLMGNRDE